MKFEDFRPFLHDLRTRLGEAGSGGRAEPPPLRADELVLISDRTPPIQRRLERARRVGLNAVRIEAAGLLATAASWPQPTYGDLLDVIVAFRRFSAWHDVVAFIDSAGDRGAVAEMPFSRRYPVAQQYAMALNRLGYGDAAERTVTSIIADYGVDAETMGLLGRVHKDRWLRSRARAGAKKHLFHAVKAYAEGLTANAREVYPAINVMTLSLAAGAARRALEPLATYLWDLLESRRCSQTGDYFDCATKIEFHSIFGERYQAGVMLDEALSRAREPWELETTAHNLQVLTLANGAGQDRPFIEGLRCRLVRESAQFHRPN